ncbi:hypothetical protein TRFO_11256 [Tritrichomonas foetus]|uniref:Tetraspanin family protein n=1 Tax=Tritrichomonas foetus TaxID=1144522 RepID=A0A1J4J938_9EUKA|nr:hypothetical protein TRFO_11256 [Tritrichomonas foetus]|eukprot:OHS94195.1 hypothetical protein TRFO_11256 [Tritrichomonas foetus]
MEYHRSVSFIKLRNICCCLTIAAAFVYASAFYTTVVYLDEIGVRGIDTRFEDFLIFSSVAILLTAIGISITSFIGNAWFKLIHFFFSSAMLILICYAFIATFWAKEHILSIIQNDVLRTQKLQKRNSCCNWNGPNDYFGIIGSKYDRTCGEVFNEYYDRKAATNSIMLAISAFISCLSVITSTILYANDDEEKNMKAKYSNM